MDEQLIAPCGMNCSLCSGYLAYVNDIRNKGMKMPYCKGCRPRDKQCSFLKKRCLRLMNGEVQYCIDCPDFPCRNLTHIDEGYKSKYRMSMIDNLEYMKEHGIQKLLEREQEKWRCPKCGDTICCHNGICFNCGLDKLKAKKKVYRWEDE